MKKKYKKLKRNIETLKEDNIIMMKALDILNNRTKTVILKGCDLEKACNRAAKTKSNG